MRLIGVRFVPFIKLALNARARLQESAVFGAHIVDQRGQACPKIFCFHIGSGQRTGLDELDQLGINLKPVFFHSLRHMDTPLFPFGNH